jgi:flagellar hook-length control protein FliK
METVMEQMGNFLLGKASQLSKSSANETSANAGSGDFLSAFNQVSQSQSKQAQSSSTSSFSLAQEANLVTVTADQEAAKTDVELILSQIDLVGAISQGVQAPTSINQYDKLVGNDLPPDLIVELEIPVEGELVIEANLVNLTENLEALDDFVTLSDDVVSSEALLAQLGTENQDALAAFAGQDLNELSSLEIAALIENYNAQAADNNQPLIQLSDSIMAWLQTQSSVSNTLVSDAQSSQSLEKRASVSDAQSSQSLEKRASVSDAQIDDDLGMQSMPKDKLQPAVLPNDKWHILGVEKSEGSKLNTSVAIPNADLTKAEFGVTLDALAANVKQGGAGTLALDSLAATIESDSSPLDVKVLQNQSSFTPLHKSDVPQFQLSLRQGAEPGQQLQDMIQKFAPVMQQQLITMVSKGIQQAEIRLDPPELGHMLVKIHVQGDQTQVQFLVAHNQTKDLVEQSLPKLREMLAQEGMLLSDSQVSQGDGRDQKGRQQGGARESLDPLDDNSAQETPLTTNRTSGLNSAIDYYA